MKKITYLLTLLVFASCQKEDAVGIPAYIKIENIYLGENDSNSTITDAWVYINGQLQGVYELPATFPVLEEGNANIKVYAGIKNNGIASDRVIYPFYSSDTTNKVLTINASTEIYPTVNIKGNIDGKFDDFDNGYSFNSDTCFQVLSGGPYGKYGSLSLSDSDSILITEINYQDFPLSFDNVPQQGSPTYMELDYKNNTSFLVGMYINFPNSPTLEKGLLWVNPKEDWNKIYIDITQTVSEAIGAETFSIFIKMQRDSNLDENKLDFDNIRIIHYEK
tara:strand:+ start:138 stop:968 length:831 start_codon:yes stop_codon:yes gene_type:complete